jgi:hypothetical protein
MRFYDLINSLLHDVLQDFYPHDSHWRKKFMMAYFEFCDNGYRCLLFSDSRDELDDILCGYTHRS